MAETEADEPFTLDPPEPEPAPAAAAVEAPAAAAAQPLPPRAPDGKFKKQHPGNLRAKAKSTFGWSDEFIDRLETADLSLAIIEAQEQQHRSQMEFAKSHVLANQPAGTPPPAPAEPDDGLDGWGVDDEGKPVPDSEVHGPIRSRFQKVVEELRQLRKQVKDGTAREQQRTTSAHFQLVDEAFEMLGEADEALFGKGAAHELPDGPEKARRRAVYGEAGLDKDRDTPRVIARKIKAARERLFPAAAPPAPKPPEEAYGETPAAPPSGKPKPTAEEWERHGPTARPTQRKAKELPHGRDRAIAGVAAKLNGQQVPADETDLENLPE